MFLFVITKEVTIVICDLGSEVSLFKNRRAHVRLYRLYIPRIPVHFRSTWAHRWSYEVSHNSILQKIEYLKIRGRTDIGHTYRKKVTSKDPIRVYTRDLKNQ